MIVETLSCESDLGHWGAAIQSAEWDDGNALDDPYSAESLRRFLETDGAVFVVAHHDGVLYGMASAFVLPKPYGQLRWLYVDEVDVAVPFRRMGVGKAMMAELFRLADAAGCEEAWLGTETTNIPALALYRSMRGEEEEVVGFTFER